MDTSAKTAPPDASSIQRRLPFRSAVNLRGHRAADVLEHIPFTVLMLGLFAAILTRVIRGSITSDSWYSLLAGHQIATSGLPQHDTLTVLTAGRRWVDQQWLAHLMFYGLWRAGGWPLALLSVVALYIGAFAFLAATARRLGASDRSVALVAAVCLLTGISNAALRAQIPAYMLFAIVLGLLLTDERHPTRRVSLVFPLLVIWANVHGSVVLGAALVSLRGLTLAASSLRSRRPVRSWLPRAGTFLVLPWVCTLASPYVLSLPGYYRSVLDNPTLDRVVSEWGPTTVRNQPVFFLLLFAGFWLVFRSRRALTPFALLAFLATALAALVAERNVIWCALVAAGTLPLALDERWRPAETPRRRRVNVALATLGIAVALAAAAATAAHTRDWFESAYPRAAVRALSAAAVSDPGLRVFADDRYADWLLFEDPDLEGRVAYDARFELLTSAQLSSLTAFQDESGLDWERAADGYRVLVLDTNADRGAIQLFERVPGTSVLYRSARIVVLLRPARGGGP